MSINDINISSYHVTHGSDKGNSVMPPSFDSGIDSDLNAVREQYFANAVGRVPLPLRDAYAPLTPRKAGAGSIDNKSLTPQQYNIQLKAKPCSISESLILLLETILTYLNHKYEKVCELNKTSTEALRKLDEDLVWVDLKNWKIEDVIAEGNMDLICKQVSDRLRRTRHLPNNSLKSIYGELSGDIKLSRLAAHDAKDGVKTVDPHIKSELPLGAPMPEGPTISEIVMAFYEFNHVDPIAEIMAEARRTEPERDRLKKLIALQKQTVHDFYVEGKMIEVEDAHKKLLNLEVMLLELLCQRYKQFDNKDADVFIEDVIQLIKDAQKSVEEYRADKKGGIHHVVKDLNSCEMLLQKKESEEAKLTRDFERAQIESYDKINTNEKKQHEIYKKLLELVEQLGVVVAERKEIVDIHVESKETYEREKSYLHEFMDVTKDHAQNLKNLQDYYENEFITIDDVERYCNNMANKLQNKVYKNILDEIRRQELDDLFKSYKDYVQNSGDLITKKQHRFDTLERQTRLMEFQKTNFKDSLDPDRERYEAEMAHLGKLLKDTETIIMEVEAQQDSTQKLVDGPLNDVKDAFQKEGQTFVHPALEYTDTAVQDRRKFINKTLRFIEDEEAAVDSKKDALEKMKEYERQEGNQYKKRILRNSNSDRTNQTAAGQPVAAIKDAASRAT